MGGLVAMYVVQGAVTVAAAIALAAWLRRRMRVGYALAGAGALGFVASQVVHLPLNALVFGALPSTTPLAVISLLGGLTAGLCEESARWLTMRYWRRDVRDTETGLMLGAGHGGVEAVIFGVLALVAAAQIATLSRADPATLGLSPAEQEQARAVVEALRDVPFLVPLVGIVERLMVLPFHLAASLIVTRSVRERRPGLLLVAILFHTLLDGPLLVLGATWGVYATELWIALIGVASLFVIAFVGGGMRRARTERQPGEPSGAPLELAGARKVYDGEVVALRGATLRIEPGTRTCLLGPNGAGKTTTIRLVTGSLSPSRGHAWLFGASVDDPAFASAKKRLGVVPQQPGMYADTSVRAWLELVRDLRGKGDVIAAAEELGLRELLDRPMGKLSGGQKRRVAIAAALVGDPELLLLDEPSAGLDPVASREVVDHLAALAPTRTILLCTHDLDEAERLCDRVVVMRGGRVLVHESLENLRARLATKVALRVAGERAALADTLASLGHADVERHEDGSLRVSLADVASEVPALLRALLDRGLAVTACVPIRASLEELFLDIVRAPDEAIERDSLVGVEEEPLPPPISWADLVSYETRRLVRKEWAQLRASGAALYTSLLLPLFFLFLAPQTLIFAARGAHGESSGPVPPIGLVTELAADPRRLPVALLPVMITVAALAAPAALITHSIIAEREQRTLELLAALPVRIHQVVAAKLACVGGFTMAVSGVFAALLGAELLAMGLASLGDVVALLVLLFAALAHATASSLWVALVAKDFRTANNLAGFAIAPGILLVVFMTTLLPGGPLRPLACALVFSASALAFARIALRGATFEKLLA